MIAAVAGLYAAHVKGGDFVFGTTAGSVSIIALTLSIVYWVTHADISDYCPKFQDWIIFAALILLFVLAVLGVSETHFSVYGLVFGSPEGAFAIFALAITSKHCAKQIQKMHGHTAPDRACKATIG